MNIKEILKENLRNSKSYLEASTAGYFDHKSWKIDLIGKTVGVVGSGNSNLNLKYDIAIKPFLSRKFNNRDIVVINTPQPTEDLGEVLKEPIYYTNCTIIIVDGSNLDYLMSGHEKIHFKDCKFYRAYRNILNPEQETFCGGWTTGTYCLNMAHYFKREEPEFLTEVSGMDACWIGDQYIVDRKTDQPNFNIDGVCTTLCYLNSYFYVTEILNMMNRQDLYKSPLNEIDQNVLLNLCLRFRVYEGKSIRSAKFSGENIMLTFDKGAAILPSSERLSLFV